MPQPVAKQGDVIVATDTHLVIPANGGTPVPTPMPFRAALGETLSPNVLIDGKRVGTVGSVARQKPGHVTASGTFQNPPGNVGKIVVGAPTVLANGKKVARSTDTAKTCNDPQDAPVGKVVAGGTVLAG